MSAKCVLLIGVRPEMSNSLRSHLTLKADTVILNGEDCLGAEYFIPNCNSGIGALKLASGAEIQLHEVIGTYSEDILDVETSSTDTDLSDLLYSEITALLSYIRHVSPNCVNPPRNGSLTSFCESIMEQWMLVDSLNIGFRIPSWKLREPDEFRMYVSNPFDYRFPSPCQPDGLVVSLEDLLGTRASCLFADEKQWHFTEDSSGSWRHVKTTATFSSLFRSLIGALRKEYLIDVGAINYFYLGLPTFWSVSHLLDLERFPNAVTESFLGVLAEKLTALDPLRPMSGSNVSVTTQSRKLVPESHPLLDGYKWRHSRTTTTVKSDKPLPDVPSHPYSAVLASASDPTASHLVSVANLLERRVYWITYESILSHPEEVDRVRENLSCATGTLVRYALPSSNSAFMAQLGVCSLLRHLENVIAPSKESTNWSKPLHTWMLSKRGFVVPDTAIGSSLLPNLSVVKGMGVLPTLADRASEMQSEFPLMFQEQQQGTEIRIHVIDRHVISHQIFSTCIDYRRDGRSKAVRCYLPLCDQQRMIELAVGEKLRFAGIDVIRQQRGLVVLEVNPMPGYHSYEGKDWEISIAILDALSGENKSLANSSAKKCGSLA